LKLKSDFDKLNKAFGVETKFSVQDFTNVDISNIYLHSILKVWQLQGIDKAIKKYSN
jgi:hypothetical protein